MKVWLDARWLVEREEAHAYLKERLELPDYYGRNLDALYDCLTELSGLELVLLHTEEVQGYYPGVERVLLAAARENEGLQVTLAERKKELTRESEKLQVTLAERKKESARKDERLQVMLAGEKEKSAREAEESIGDEMDRGQVKAGTLRIRVAREEDAESLLAIYAPYVTDTAITFEYDVPSVEEFRRRIRDTLKKYPYLAAEQDGRLVGYAYAGPFHTREAYQWAVETSVYVEKGCGRRGVGRALYEVLEAALALQNILNVNACIAYPEAEDEYLTEDSLQFHERMGYRMVGKFQRCGYKFGRWYGAAWMEKHIGAHGGEPFPVKGFAEIREELAERFGIV